MSHLRAVPGGGAAVPQRSGSATQVRVEAPVRVTLTHAVTGTADDGGPVLSGVVQAVRLIETVTARRQSLDAHGLVTLSDDDAPAAPGTAPADAAAEEPAARAARLLAEELDVTEGVDLLLRRRAGLGSGLAVGAADAAAALLACNALWGTGLSTGELAEIGARLDPAVPFAVTGATAVDHGTGEHLSPLMTRGAYQWVLALPEEDLDPAAVLTQHAARTGAEPAGDATDEPSAALTAALRAGDPAALAPALRNDLQETVIALRPRVRDVIELAESAGALRALVTGTGPAVACLVPSSGTAVRVSRALAASGLVGTAVRADAPVAGARTVG
ncbi:4-(cytidine 5'-diphospho)-2-C-methyl-D-erythritol kinase [Actinomyces radicidentis]|uniref:GHMP family kinase ATP-binding protein n=1 Tax=Actinomyces radicidentis TaxID=111015 RepID=UPI0028F03915|nr:4-(cytidine 5'-diphospho)-2-C-methyl-D-erythritol kinase [Actinomyces radicidentis]